MAIERLTAEDALMLWPDEVWPQDIGALVLLEPGTLLDTCGELRLEPVREAIASRLHLVPRFRQLLYVPPRRLGGPLWVDARDFDIREHVRALRVSAPGKESDVLATVEDLRRRRLDRSRPLWEMWFLTGLACGGVGLFVRMHHCVADGMAGVATMASFLDLEQDAELPVAEPWTPAAPPTERELLDDVRSTRRIARRRRLVRLAHPIDGLRNVAAAWPAIHEIVAERPLTPTSLARVVGADRRLALVRTDLAHVKSVARAHGAKVNDVLLTVIAGGVRSLFHSRGEAVDDTVVRIYVPISLHEGDRSKARGNLITQMVVELPVGVADAHERLRRIAAETGERKARPRPPLAKVPHRGFAGRVFLKLIDRQGVNVSSADIPGPPVPLYFAGARLLEVFPMAQLLGKNSLSVGAMSYAGRFNMMVIADRDAYPDLQVLIDGIRAETAALGVAPPASEAA